ncbi:hypothetical protein GC093_32605 [Paenibacillus sp. LMG 31456]|uniref:JAB domain-containing protein n=1 Tax=Paenibacillus foliorum TaxID=2654974 RepID=A0A972GX59_9BACL|nr:M67 family metallopeptidase [Paenibacillus foliorum]NOU97933.1 hypothetical protein [Paenibacillus foliorum]
MVRTVFIKKSTLDHITCYCMKKKPYEACGFLLGSHEAETIYADEFIPVTNIAENAVKSFVMDPAVMIPIVTNHSSHVKPIVGVLHSHPTAASIPSAEDLYAAWLHIPSHWIVSLQHDECYDIQVFHYYRNNFDDSCRTGSSDKISYAALTLKIFDY